ncbi:carboxyl transferase domain-containing protein [Nocardioides massiliensis]|uniref:Acetyl-CoA carboxylase carboxyl transferase subunit beta n=1 Tax=Nocardioides massiliensis TaxID=1325935 RepID=A0ABT9NJH2_9ACTN|nr:carboxyl transferase domain-containing protein [Nocardioides massiliensis]MDP9820200.1 acetyl-CoA carboxylase carboxyl transferase subunit beta [Nocardioides massiliensis]
MSPSRTSARDLIDTVLDAGSLQSWDEPIDDSAYAEGYRAELARARERSGCDESVLTGRGTVKGRPVAFIVSEFRFLAGSIGQDAARRIVSAIRRATAEGLPLVASTASGGTRMQEGTPAFVGMVDISRAIMDHRAAKLPYLVHLRHPTTGGVFASWGSLGHVTIAEPEALVGFLGPKVYELLNGEPFPTGVQVSENLTKHGIIDAVVEHDQLPQLVEQALSLFSDPMSEQRLTRRPKIDLDNHTYDVWDSIQRTRAGTRAGVRDILRLASDTTLRLQGTEEGERDPSVIVALARLDGVPCVVVGQDREAQHAGKLMGPGALREARRGMKLANELDLPLVTFIDTPGAELSQRAEEGALGGEIARCIATMSTMQVPTVSVLLGEGTGGGALALLPADVTIAAQHSWLTPLPPEGASAIVHGHTDAAAELAEQQQVSSIDLMKLGVVRHLIAEFDDDTPQDLASAVAAEVSHWLRELTAGR